MSNFPTESFLYIKLPLDTFCRESEKNTNYATH